MKRQGFVSWVVAILVVAMAAVATPGVAQAQDDVESLKEELDALKEKIASGDAKDEQIIQALLDLVSRIEALEQASIELNEKMNTIEGGGISSEDIEDLRERIADLESDSRDNFDSIFREFARRVALSGYTTFGFVVPEPISYPEESRPWFHSFGLNLLLNSQITQQLSFLAELQQQETSRLGQGASGNAITLRRSYMEMLLPVTDAIDIGFRFGILLVPFGWYNRTPEEWRYAFDTRPIVNEIVFPTVYSDVGIEMFGFLYRGDIFSIDYDLAVINGLTENIGVSADLGSGGAFDVPRFGGQAGEPVLQPGLRGARPAESIDNNSNKAVVGRFGFSFVDLMGIGELLSFGVSGYVGRYDSDEYESAEVKPEDDFWLYMIGADLRFITDSFQMRAEFAHVEIDEFPDTIVVDLDGDPETLGDLTNFRYPASITGVSVDLEYHFWFEGLNDTALAIGDNPSFFVATRFDYATTTKAEVLIADEISDLSEIMLSFSAGYRPYHRAAIRLEWIQGGLDWMGVSGFSDLVLTDTWLFAFSVSLGF